MSTVYIVLLFLLGQTAFLYQWKVGFLVKETFGPKSAGQTCHEAFILPPNRNCLFQGSFSS